MKLMDNIFYRYLEPETERVAKQIDKDIINCIKKERETRGSIVKRYGNWANFISKECLIVSKQPTSEFLLDKSLFYKGKFVNNYHIGNIYPTLS